MGYMRGMTGEVLRLLSGKILSTNTSLGHLFWASNIQHSGEDDDNTVSGLPASLQNNKMNHIYTKNKKRKSFK